LQFEEMLYDTKRSSSCLVLEIEL